MTACQRKKQKQFERFRLVLIIALCNLSRLPITQADNITTTTALQPANLNLLTPDKIGDISAVTISTSVSITSTDTNGETKSTSSTTRTSTSGNTRSTSDTSGNTSENTRRINGSTSDSTKNISEISGNAKSSGFSSVKSTNANTSDTTRNTSSSTTKTSTSTAHDPDSYCRKPLPLSHFKCDNGDWGEVSCLERRARIGTNRSSYWKNHCTFLAASGVPAALLADEDFCEFDEDYGRVKCGNNTPYNFTAQCRFTMLHCTFEMNDVHACKRKFESLFEEGGACVADDLACPTSNLYYLNKVIYTNSTFPFGVLRKNKILEHCHLWEAWKTNLLVGMVVAFSVAVALYFVIKKSTSLHARHFNRKRMEDHLVVKMLDNLLEEPTVTIETVHFQFSETPQPENNNEQQQHPRPLAEPNGLLLPNGGPPTLESRGSGSIPGGYRLSSVLSSDTVSSNRSSLMEDLSFQPGGSGAVGGVRFLSRPPNDARPVLNSYQLENNGGRSSPWRELLPSRGPLNPADCERPSMSSDCSFSNPTYLTKGGPENLGSPAPHWGDPLTPRGDDEVFDDAPHFHAPEGRAIIIGNPSYL